MSLPKDVMMANVSEQNIKLEGSFRYTCGYCGTSSNELSVFGADGKCTSCGGANPEFPFFAEGNSFPESVLVYFAADAKSGGETLMKRMESEGFRIITRGQIDLRIFDENIDAKRLIRDRMGGIIIIPSDKLVEEESGNIEFLFDNNRIIPKAGISKTVFTVTDPSQKEYLTELYYKSNSSITALSMCDGADFEKSGGVVILGNDMLDRSLKHLKSRWFRA